MSHQEDNFLEKKLPDDSKDTLRIKNFVEIPTLSRTVCEINVFLSFMQKFKMATKSGRDYFWRNLPDGSADKLRIKYCQNCLSSTVSEINELFFHFTEPSYLTKYQENNFWYSQMTADSIEVKNFISYHFQKHQHGHKKGQ